MHLKHSSRSGEIEVVDIVGWLDRIRLKLPTGDEMDASLDAVIDKVKNGDYLIMDNLHMRESAGMADLLSGPMAVRVGDSTVLDPVEQLTHEQSAGIFAQALSWLLKPNEGICIKNGRNTYSITNDIKSSKIVINRVDGNMPDGQMLWSGPMSPMGGGDEDDD